MAGQPGRQANDVGGRGASSLLHRLAHVLDVNRSTIRLSVERHPDGTAYVKVWKECDTCCELCGEARHVETRVRRRHLAASR